MPLHDAYLRRTPYERVLPDPDFPGRRFPAIAEEAGRKGIGLDDPGAFAILEAASEALDELRPDDDDPDSLRRHALVLFHAFHHHAVAKPVYLLSTPVVRLMTESEPWDAEGGDVGLPPSVYLQFPQHLVWVRGGDAGPPASVDGAFRTRTADGRIHVMAVAGLTGAPEGFTVLPVPGAPADHEGDWVTGAMRDGGRDFASDLPGSELERLYEIRTAGEALKLVARAVRVIGRFPEGVGPRSTAPEAPPSPGEPVPSSLAFRRVALEAG
jgi:hypothetical protein